MVVADTGMVVDHLPIANSRVTKYILDRGARFDSIPVFTNYCVSSLSQEGLKIPCDIEIHMRANVKSKELMKIYKTYFDTLYYQRQETQIVWSFIDGSSEIEKNDEDLRNTTQSKQLKDYEVNATLSRDIRTFLKNVAQYLVRKQVILTTW